MARKNNAPPYTPDPEQIAAMCEDIQGGWTERQELSRRVAKYEPHELTPIPAKTFRLGLDAGSI